MQMQANVFNLLISSAYKITAFIVSKNFQLLEGF